MKKIAVITGTRAEYGIFYPLLSKLKQSDTWDLQIIVTGMHLSPEFGLTYRNIEEDGFTISDKVEMLLSSDTDVGITKSVGLGVIGFADSFSRLNPDLVVILGDRYETYAGSIAAFLAKIPICHLHGGELTEGLIDDGIRHSITKLSSYHFVSTDIYRNRVIQMGETPKRVFNVGALGTENVNNTELLSKNELESMIDFKIDKKTVLLTYHPVTLEMDTSERDFDILLKVFDKFKDLRIIFTMPNSDANGRIIMKKIDEYVEQNKERCAQYVSLGRLKYLSALQYMEFVIGNSSSGIIEVPSFKIPTIDIGDRQRGRVKPLSVISCDVDEESLIMAIEKALSDDFQLECRNQVNPYDGGNTSTQIIEILNKLELNEEMLKKTFFDLEVGDYL